MNFLIAILIYSLLVLLFVPLGRLGKAQDWVKAKVKQLIDKLEK
jgi:competence protein ComGC